MNGSQYVSKSLLISNMYETAAQARCPCFPHWSQKYSISVLCDRHNQHLLAKTVNMNPSICREKNIPKLRWDAGVHKTPACLLIIFPFLYSLRWRWSLRMWWTEACSRRATVTSAMPSSSLSPSARLTTRWVVPHSCHPHQPYLYHFKHVLAKTVLIHYTTTKISILIRVARSNKHTLYLTYLLTRSLWVFE